VSKLVISGAANNKVRSYIHNVPEFKFLIFIFYCNSLNIRFNDFVPFSPNALQKEPSFDIWVCIYMSISPLGLKGNVNEKKTSICLSVISEFLTVISEVIVFVQSKTDTFVAFVHSQN
jgi:hypothetical protein